MSGSVNRIHLVGNLARDPELRYTQAGKPVCKLVVATSRKWTNKQTNQPQEETEFHRVTVWSKTAEYCNEFLLKGRQVYVEGRLKTSSYEQDGVKKYSTEIVAENVVFLGGREDGQGGGVRGSGGRASDSGQGVVGTSGEPAPSDPRDYNEGPYGQ